VSLVVSACQGVESEEETSAVPERAQSEAALYPIEDCPVDAYCPTPVYCGNNLCDGNETDVSCPQDCTYCGDGMCNGWESTANCPMDCGSRCGDGTCNGGETVNSCKLDCGPKLRSTRLERVRRCRNDYFFCNSTRTQEEYHWWDDFGVADDKQKETYIAQPMRPPREDVRHLVLLLAGQQFGSGLWSRVTGQDNDYKQAFDRTDGSHQVGLDEYSLASKLVEEMVRTSNDTFMGLAFDARFNYGFTPSNKQDIENAYYEWLKEKAYLWNLQSIYLAGHSRGGCLAARLARRFKQDVPSIPVILHLFDPVCDGDNGEFGTWESSIDNPVSSEWNWYGYSTDFSAQFPTTYNLAVYNMISGAQVLDSGVADGIETARAMSQYQAWTPSYTMGDWYTQKWFNIDHSNMSSLYWDALRHYSDSCDRFGCR
jgi:pimeloyl-ACP methyl ester carboxylesterase